MFGLYPAGPNWVRTFALGDCSSRDLQKSLVDLAGFTAAIQHQPFGQHRGAGNGKLRLLLHLARGFFRNDLQRGLRLRDGQFNFQQTLEARLLRPKSTHLRARVTRYHFWQSLSL